MHKEKKQEAISEVLQKIPLKIEEQLFNIENIKINKYNTYNFSQIPEKYDNLYFKAVVNEINQIEVEKENIILIDLKNICKCKICILLIDSKIIIINKSNICFFKGFFDQLKNNFIQSDNQKILFMTEDAQKEFQFEFTGYKCKYSNLFSNTDIESFEKKLIFQFSTKYENFSFLIKTLISNFILLRSFYLAKNYQNENKDHNQYNFDDFIFIRKVGESTDLYFNVNNQFLCILKFFSEQNLKRYYHELEFYQSIRNQHPFICKYFGHFDYYVYKYIVIEFIEGETLSNFIQNNRNKLSYSEKIKIIIEILLSVEYIHSKNIILRDLKYDNVIIDSNHDAFLIDFDLSKEIKSNFCDITSDIGSDLFAAPEQYESTDYSYKVDLYSIGVIINFIITHQIIRGEEFLNELKNELPKFPGNFLFLTNLYKNLLEYQPDKRPNISTVINDFLIKISDFILAKIIYDDDNEIRKKLSFLVKIRLQYLNEIINQKYSSFVDISEIYDFIGIVYNRGKDVQKNLEKSFEYLKLSANLNNPKAQCDLGLYYINNEINIVKGLKYLNLSANNNYARAFYLLGTFYFEGKLVQKDIKKAKYYFELCGKVDDYFILDCLGYYYYYKNVSQNINKAISYLKSSSKLHNPLSQCLLGNIYFENKYIERDIDKAIHYFNLSANQNNSISQIILGQISSEKGFLSNETKRIINEPNILVDKTNSNSLTYIGLQYCEGDIYSKNIDKAIHYFILASQLNNPIAQYLLGIIYTNNKTVRNIDKAIHYLTLAANNNDQNALFFLGFNYLNGKIFPHKINKGINYLDILSNRFNNQKAQLCLGYEYLYGKNLNKNVDKAIHYILLAAKQNNQNAQIILGDIYFQNNYLPKDLNKSIYYYSLAAEQNNSNAQFSLGLIYLYEKEFQDIDKGIYYLTLSANQYYSKAEYLLGIIYLRGEKIKKNINKSIHYLKLSSQKGNSSANFELGMIYLSGIYVPHDIEKSIYHFTLSSNQNNPRAHYILFHIYFDTKYHLQNIQKSIHYLQLSANQNIPHANFILGTLYYEGKYLPKNINKAIHHYKEASNMNNYYAKNNLGVIYLNGIGVNKNVYFAIEYFEDAIRKSNDIFSIYNLSRIYYFGIECDKNVPKSIELLKQVSNHMFLPLDIFLFLILYINNDYKNVEEVKKCRDSILKRFYFDILLHFSSKEKCLQELSTIKDCAIDYKMDTFDSLKSIFFPDKKYKKIFHQRQK